MPAGMTVAHLVDEFVATLHQYGIAVDRRAVELEMRDRIADIAERLGTSPEAVLLDHAGRGWGHQMAYGVLAQIRRERLLPEAPIAS